MKDLSYYLNMDWNLDNIPLYRRLDDKIRESDALFLKLFDIFNIKYIRSILYYAKGNVIHRNVIKVAQKYPEHIAQLAPFMTKEQILNFIKTNKPSILSEFFNLSISDTFYDSSRSILEDQDIKIALFPFYTGPILSRINSYNPEEILEFGKKVNWDKKFYEIIPMITSKSVMRVIVNSHEFPKDFRQLVAERMPPEVEKEQEEEEEDQEEGQEEYQNYEYEEEYQDEDYEEHDYLNEGLDPYSNSEEDRTVNIQLREKEYAYLFRKNTHKLALRLYKGKKKSVLDLFNLYSNIVDIRSNTFSDTLKKSFNLWTTIVKEQSKQFTPDERIIKEIGLSLKAVENFLNTHKVIDLKNKTELYKTARYHNLIKDLVSYMVSFFAHLGIKVKPLPIVSSITGIKIIALTTNTDEKEELLEKQLSLVNQMKNKLTEVFLSNIHINPEEDVEKEYRGVPYYETSQGFVSLETMVIYSTLEKLLEDVKKHKIIDKNYSSLVLNQGKIINPKNNKVIKTITYLNHDELTRSIKEYQYKIHEYNSNLKSYEARLTNEPKTIEVGDHSFKVVKVLDRNMSRLVVVEGKYKGHYVDELVSSTGEVIGSKTKASPYLTETAKGMKELNVYDKNFGLYSINKDKPFETFKKLNGIKDSTLSPDFLNTRQQYLDEVSTIVSRGQISIDQLHKLTGLNIVSNIPNTIADLYIKRKYDNKIESSIHLDGLAYIKRGIFFDRGYPHYIYNDVFTTDKCLPDGLGSRVFAQQVKTASEMGFEHIETHAARGGGFVGYYVWPKLGYDTTISLSYIGERISSYYKDRDKDKIKFEYLKKWLVKNNIDIQYPVSLSAIYACKAGDRFIGQELWKKYGDSMNMQFELSAGSLSMRILESYVNLKSKKDDIDPSEFFSIDYSRFKAIDLECYLEGGENSTTLQDAIEHNVKNYENGVLERIYRNPKTREQFKGVLQDIRYDKIDKITEILTHSGFENVKLANQVQSDDPILKELDMEILNQIWSGISKQYKQ